MKNLFLPPVFCLFATASFGLAQETNQSATDASSSGAAADTIELPVTSTNGEAANRINGAANADQALADPPSEGERMRRYVDSFGDATQETPSAVAEYLNKAMGRNPQWTQQLVAEALESADGDQQITYDVVRAALEQAPSMQDEIVAGAMSVRPQHESEITAAVDAITGANAAAAVAANSADAVTNISNEEYVDPSRQYAKGGKGGSNVVAVYRPGDKDSFSKAPESAVMGFEVGSPETPPSVALTPPGFTPPPPSVLFPPDDVPPVPPTPETPSEPSNPDGPPTNTPVITR